MTNTISKRRHPSLRLTAPALAFLPLLAVMGTCDSQQPAMLCATSIGTFAVKYTLIEGTGDCAQLTSGKVGVESYLPRTTDHPGFERPIVAIRAEEMGTLIRQYDAAARIDGKQVTSMANFTDANPAGDGFCRVGAMNAASMTLASIAASPDGAKPALPAVDVRYEWNDLRFYVTPSSIGAQFSADLVYRKDGCTARYRANGIFPAVSCKTTTKAPDGTMTTSKNEGLCSPCADPSMGRSRGSGIHPDVETVCEDKSLLCLPGKETPSLRPEHFVCR
jgi:hypothetical protein